MHLAVNLDFSIFIIFLHSGILKTLKQLVHCVETRAPKSLFTIALKREGVEDPGGPCLMNIGDTPDLEEGGRGRRRGNFGTLVFSFQRCRFDAPT